MNAKQRTLLSCAIGGVLGVGGVVLAQDAPAGRTTNVLEEVVVTAQKREQSVQDVPVAVSAYGSARRDLLGVNTVEDFARITPSLSYTNNDRLSIRGFGRLTNSIGTDPSVALYSDGIFSTSMADTSTPSLFIERTEILRGPQGTLYGRNSIGGTLNVISKRPTKDFEGEVRGSIGNYGTWRTDGLFSGPITDSLRFLIGGSREMRDEGFIKNVGPADDTATSDRWMGEAQLEADFGSHVTARLRYSKFEWQDSYGVGNTLGTNVSPFDTVSLTGSGTSALYYNSTFGYQGVNPAIADPYKIDTNANAAGTLKDHQRIHLDVTADLGGATLKFLSGYQQYAYFTSSDSDNTPQTAPLSVLVPAGGTLSVDLDGPNGPLPSQNITRPAFTATNIAPDARTFYREYQQWLSNEINLSSNGDGAVQWIVGLYQYQQKWDQPQGIRIVGDNSLFAPAGAPANPSGAFLSVSGHLDTKSYAGFGQVDWTFADAWTATLGLRYTYDKKTGTDFARYVARGPSTAIGAADAAPTLENAIIGAVRAQVPGAPLALIQTLVPTVGPQVAAAVLAATQGLALDVTQSQVCGAAACPSDLRAAPGGGLERDLAGDWNAVTGTAGLQWRPADDTNLYLRYSRGYKSGGWLGSNGLTPDPYADPEHVDTYELGAKQVFGGRLQVNAALHYSNYDGMQTPLTVALGTITAGRFLNLNARVQGVELETIWSPVDALQLLLNYSFLDTKITDGCCFVDNSDPAATANGARPVASAGAGRVAQTLVGNQLPLSPEQKLTAGINYTWTFGPGSLTASGTYTHIDDQQSTIWANPIYTAPSFDLTDARLLWQQAEGRYTIIAYAKNAFDEVAYGSSSGSSPTAVGIRRSVSLIYPRTYGMEVQYRFGK
jgi:iron complex outermembrane receptor protein